MAGGVIVAVDADAAANPQAERVDAAVAVCSPAAGVASRRGLHESVHGAVGCILLTPAGALLDASPPPDLSLLDSKAAALAPERPVALLPAAAAGGSSGGYALTRLHALANSVGGLLAAAPMAAGAPVVLVGTPRDAHWLQVALAALVAAPSASPRPPSCAAGAAGGRAGADVARVRDARPAITPSGGRRRATHRRRLVRRRRRQWSLAAAAARVGRRRAHGALRLPSGARRPRRHRRSLGGARYHGVSPRLTREYGRAPPQRARPHCRPRRRADAARRHRPPLCRASSLRAEHADAPHRFFDATSLNDAAGADDGDDGGDGGGGDEFGWLLDSGALGQWMPDGSINLHDDAEDARLRRASAAGPVVPPRTAVETWLVEFVQHEMQIDELSVTASLFEELGVDSMKRLTLIGAIRRTLGVNVTIAELEWDSVRDLATRIEMKRDLATTDVDAEGLRLQGRLPPLVGSPLPRGRRLAAQLGGIVLVCTVRTLSIGPFAAAALALLRRATVASVVLLLPVALAAQLIFTVLIGIALKWIIVGRLKVGAHPLWSWPFLRWWLAQRCGGARARGAPPRSRLAARQSRVAPPRRPRRRRRRRRHRRHLRGRPRRDWRERAHRRRRAALRSSLRPWGDRLRTRPGRRRRRRQPSRRVVPTRWSAPARARTPVAAGERSAVPPNAYWEGAPARAAERPERAGAHWVVRPPAGLEGAMLLALGALYMLGVATLTLAPAALLLHHLPLVPAAAIALQTLPALHLALCVASQRLLVGHVPPGRRRPTAAQAAACWTADRLLRGPCSARRWRCGAARSSPPTATSGCASARRGALGASARPATLTSSRSAPVPRRRRRRRSLAATARRLGRVAADRRAPARQALRERAAARRVDRRWYSTLGALTVAAPHVRFVADSAWVGSPPQLRDSGLERYFDSLLSTAKGEQMTLFGSPMGRRRERRRPPRPPQPRGRRGRGGRGAGAALGGGRRGARASAAAAATTHPAALSALRVLPVGARAVRRARRGGGGARGGHECVARPPRTRRAAAAAGAPRDPAGVLRPRRPPRARVGAAPPPPRRRQRQQLAPRLIGGLLAFCPSSLIGGSDIWCGGGAPPRVGTRRYVDAHPPATLDALAIGDGAVVSGGVIFSHEPPAEEKRQAHRGVVVGRRAVVAGPLVAVQPGAVVGEGPCSRRSRSSTATGAAADLAVDGVARREGLHARPVRASRREGGGGEEA